MKLEDRLNAISDRIKPPKHGGVGRALKYGAAAAASIWVLLQLKRELYGPGGSKMSPYDPEIDDVWDDESEAAEVNEASKK